MSEYSETLLRLLGRVWRLFPDWTFGQLMAAVGNEVGASVDNMTNVEIEMVLMNVDHNGWGAY